MRSWLFRNRRRLEVLYGALPTLPEGAAARTADERDATAGSERLRVLTLLPHPRRFTERAG